MKIASFNTNGIRARMPILLDWLEKEYPDVLCIQETKVQDPDFPLQPLKDAGYACVFKGQKSYNGVAILSKAEPETIRVGFDENDVQEGSRLMAVAIGGIDIVNTYVPQGQAPDSEKFAYKIDWLKRLHRYFKRFYRPTDRLVWVGDFNVALEPIDVYDPEKLVGSVGFHPKEHETLSNIKSWGFVDVYRKHNPDEKTFTFWDYRIRNAVKRGVGWRIDHVWATVPMADISKRAWIDLAPRLHQKPSDHTFIVAEFDF